MIEPPRLSLMFTFFMFFWSNYRVMMTEIWSIMQMRSHQRWTSTVCSSPSTDLTLPALVWIQLSPLSLPTVLLLSCRRRSSKADMRAISKEKPLILSSRLHITFVYFGLRVATVSEGTTSLCSRTFVICAESKSETLITSCKLKSVGKTMQSVPQGRKEDTSLC